MDKMFGFLKKHILAICLVTLLIIITVSTIVIININKENENGKIDNVGDNIDDYISDKEEIKLPKYELDFSVPIFMYHSISDTVLPGTYASNYVSPRKFEEQLKHIVDNGYQTIFASELDELENYTKPVSLTFDDGFDDFYNYAFPLLKKYNVKATFYVIMGYINGKHYCTLEQLREMASSGLVEIESHTVSHRELAKLNNEEIVKELKDSYNMCMEYFNKESKTIAYPVGSYNNAVIEETKKTYKIGLKMDGGIYTTKDKNMYELPRIYARGDMTQKEYISYLTKSFVKRGVPVNE